MSCQEPSVPTVHQAPQAGSPARDFKTATCLCLTNPEPSWGQGLPRAMHRGVRPQLWTLEHALCSSEPVTALGNARG